MSRYVMFSFDDGRSDTYDVVVPILRRYNLTATINVVTDFILHPQQYSFANGTGRAMTVSQLKDCQKSGIELACHGSTHNNTIEDILKGIDELKEMGLSIENIGFASPYSMLTLTNSKSVQNLVSSGVISYIRSGVQVRREGLMYSALTALERKTHNRQLYWLLNRKNILNSASFPFFISVTVANSTTLDQIQYLISKLKDNEGVIFNFHSILDPSDPHYDGGSWCWDARRFDSLCSWLAQNGNNFCVCTTQSYLSAINSVKNPN